MTQDVGGVPNGQRRRKSGCRGEPHRTGDAHIAQEGRSTAYARQA